VVVVSFLEDKGETKKEIEKKKILFPLRQDATERGKPSKSKNENRAKKK